VTSLPRTLVDLSAVLDERHLSIALDSVLARHRGIGVRTVRRVLDRLRSQGRTGAGVLERLLEERAMASVHLDSALERRFSFALRRAGLPRPAEHYDVVEGGRHVAELDFAYPRERVGIELNGASIHRRHAVWERDQQRLSELAAAGWRVLNVTWSQLEMGEAAVMDRVARALAIGGPFQDHDRTSWSRQDSSSAPRDSKSRRHEWDLEASPASACAEGVTPGRSAVWSKHQGAKS
jgi:hypothetical protein